MAHLHSKPTLTPREYKDGSGWYVEATWGDGTRAPEQIGGFGSDSEVHDWISQKSTAYFKAQKN